MLLGHRKIFFIKRTKIGTEIDRWAAATISSAQETDREETPGDAKSSILRRADGWRGFRGRSWNLFFKQKKKGKLELLSFSLQLMKTHLSLPFL